MAVSLREVFQADRLTADVLKQARDRGAQIAYEAIQQKAALGDREVKIEVDGSTGRQIESWKAKIRLAWGSQEQLGQLIDFVYDGVVKRTPRDSGALAGAWVWTLNRRTIAFGSVPGSVLAKRLSLGDGDELSLVNMKPYIRKAEHGFISKQTEKAKARKRKKPLKFGFRSRGIADSVARAARTKFKGFTISDPWFEFPGHVISRSARDQRIPTVTIRRSKRSIGF